MVGEEGVVKGGGEDILAASGGGIGQARGESRGRGMEALAVTFSLREGEENVVKGGVNSFGREHGNKRAKPMKMEGGEDMPGEFCQVHSKGDVQILKGSLEGMKVSLGMSDPVEKVNKLMGDGVFMEEGNLFDGVEDNGGFEDCSVE